MSGLFQPNVFQRGVFWDEANADGGWSPFLDVAVRIIRPISGAGAGVQAHARAAGRGRAGESELTELWLLGALTDDEWRAEMAA